MAVDQQRANSGLCGVLGIAGKYRVFTRMCFVIQAGVGMSSFLRFGVFPSTLTLFLHQFQELLLIDRNPGFFGHLKRQIYGETVSVMEFKCRAAGQSGTCFTGLRSEERRVG